MSHPRIRLVAIAAAFALTTGGLAGCSLIPGPVKEIVQEGAKDANPLGSLPADWPDAVPVIDGDVLVGISPTEGSWGATIQAADESALDEAIALLEGAGFAAMFEGTGAYENDTYTVTVQGAALDEGGYGVAYIVVAK